MVPLWEGVTAEAPSVRPAVVAMAVGVPAEPVLVWKEDFENGLGTAASALKYSTVTYTGAGGETYTGSPPWLNPSICNGLIVSGGTVVSGNSVTVGGATCAFAGQLRQLAYALGDFNDTATVNDNHAVTAFTAGDPGSGWMAQMQQLKTLPLGQNRFVAISINGAAINCQATSPSYMFGYTSNLTAWTQLPGYVNMCTSSASSTVSVPAFGSVGARSDVKVGRYFALSTFLMPGSQVGVRVGNNNGSGIGNDAAFDDLMIWDATPIIDKAFSPSTIPANGVSTLTLRITNTSELAEKKGWSFTDTFPTGLKVANPAATSTTCGTGTTVSAVAGSNTLSVTNGNLTAGTASCLVKVNVTAAADGSYVNGAANIDPKIGVDLPLAPATLTVFTPKPKLSMTKTATPTTITAAGQTVNYTITASNTGNVDLTNVSVSDPKVGPLSCTPSIPVATLAIGASISCEVAYVATQADVDSGTIANTATGSASSAGGAVSGTASANVTATRTPGLSVAKSVTPTQFAGVGSTLNYSITATNTGNVTLTNVSVSDPKVSSLACTPTIPVASLAPGAQIVCTGSRTVTAADDTAGVVTNTATATGTPPVGPAVTGSGTARSTGLPKNPQITLTKTASPTAMTTVGETITYTIVAKNTGDAVLTDVSVTDPMVTGLTCVPSVPVATLALGESIACQGTHVVTQADLDSSPLLNTASASGSSIVGPVVTDADATVTTAAAPALTVDKTVSATSFLLAGEVLSYEVRVTNSGNVTLSNVSVTDPKVSGLTCVPSLPVASLAPGAQIVCTGSRILTNSDVIAGGVVNTATATGTAPGGSPGAVSGSDTATSTAVPQDPKLDVTKSAVPTTFSNVGDRVSYVITAVNSGNVPLTNVTVSDPGVASLTCTPSIPVATLSTGDAITCTGSRIVTQADIDAGSIVNTATGSGKSPLDDPISDTDSVTVPGPAAEPMLSLAKSAAPVTYSAAGDVLTYTIVATNTGNVSLSDVSVSDPGVTGLTCSPSIPVATLAPGAKVTCTGTRVVTQSEVDSGSVSNTANAVGTPPDGPELSADASSVVNGLPAVPRLSVVKSASPAAFTEVDSQIDYTLTLTNIGTATLKDITVSDSLETPVCAPSLTGLELAPGEQVICTYSHIVTGLEATNGHVDNTASVSATSLSGVPTSDEASLVTPGPVPAPQLSVAKSADPAVFTNVGETVTFTIIATNTGNVPLADVTVSDPSLTLSCDQSLPVAVLAVGASIRCSASREITQADVDAGSLSNIASASGNDLLGNPVSGVDAVTVPGPVANPSLATVKSASTASVSSPGELVRYSFEVTNTGNVTVDEIVVSDPMVSNLVCAQSVLAPGQSMLCTATYLTTQADVDGGSLVNVASVSGTPARGSLTPANDSELIDAVRRPALALAKTAEPSAFVAEGDLITYTIVATNTGNVTLSDVDVTDPLVTLDCSPAAPVASLAPGAAVVCTGTLTVSASDAATGSVSNTASASATAPGGTDLSEDATSVVDGPTPNPRLSLSKSALPAVFSAVGQVITYTLVATNTGNVTLDEVTIDDPFLSSVECPSGGPFTLAPNDSVTCTGTHVVTQAELDGGSIPNTATVEGRTPLDALVDDSASLTLTGLPPVPALSLVKTADPAAFTEEGDYITWTIAVTNTGTATLADVSIDDDAGTLSCTEELPLASLAPGESITCTVVTRVSAADAERGSVSNSASASATAPDGAPVDASGTATADGPVPNPRLSVVKTSIGSFVGAGETLPFTIVATNTGNVTLSDVTLSDEGLELSCDQTLPVASLAVGESITCTASVVTTQADVDAGFVHNEVTASGSTPLGAPVSADAAVDVPAPAASPALTMLKQASVESVSSVGTEVTYTFVVTNSGNVTISGVTVSDPMVSGVVCDDTTLDAGESTTCSATYSVTRDDLAKGALVNVASVSGVPARGTLPAGGASARVDVGQSPALEVTKSVLPARYRTVGQTLTFTVVATNTGNVELEDVTVDDPGFELDCDVSIPVAILATGESITCTTTLVVTQAHIDAGSLQNTASASGSTASGTVVDDETTLDVPGPTAAPGLSLRKTANPTLLSYVGQVVTFNFFVTNTGNVTIRQIRIVDSMLPEPAVCAATTLAPGESTTCSGTYVVTAEDLAGGTLVNSATVRGQGLDGVVRSAAAAVQVPVDPLVLPATGGGSSGLPLAIVLVLTGVLFLRTSSPSLRRNRR
jgi:uncharacterized repeat protein (TIGR01451 family)